MARNHPLLSLEASDHSKLLLMLPLRLNYKLLWALSNDCSSA